MARFCFYCGRELKSGEKCGCRSQGRAGSSTQHEHGKSQDSAQESMPKKRPGRMRRIIDAFNPFAGSPSRSSSRRSAGRQPAGAKARNRQTYQTVRPDLHGIQAGLKLAGRLIARPAEAVLTPDMAGASGLVFAQLLVHGLLTGLLLVLGARQTFLQQILSLNIATASSGTASGGNGFLFVQGLGIGISLPLLLAITYHIFLRVLYKQQTHFVVLLYQLNPSMLLATLFLLAALPVLPGSPFSALMMLAAGACVSALSQFIILRRVTRFEENRVMILVGFVLMVYGSILAMLLNLAIPVLKALLDHSIVM